MFVVRRASKDAILGMPFLTAHNFSLHFALPLLLVDGKGADLRRPAHKDADQ